MVEDWHVKTVDATVDATVAWPRTTTYNSQCMVPVQKAVDPKWSSDLKRTWDGMAQDMAGQDGQRGSPLSLKVTSFLQILHGDVHF